MKSKDLADKIEKQLEGLQSSDIPRVAAAAITQMMDCHNSGDQKTRFVFQRLFDSMLGPGDRDEFRDWLKY